MVEGPNLYVYVHNSPVNALDPWGLCGGVNFFDWLHDLFMLGKFWVAGGGR